MSEQKDYCAFPKCNKELVHKPGKRKKKYCSQSCNNKHWLSLNPQYERKSVRVPVEEYEELKKYKADALLNELTKKFPKSDAEIKEDAFKKHEQENTKKDLSETKYPSDFNGLLKFAKEGKVENKEEFKAWVNLKPLTSNQKSMILSKL